MQILFGTGNQAKLSAMKSRLEKIGINAKLKALAYYEAFRISVFSCDSGLYFDHVPDEVQPGVHVRNVNGKCLSDEEMEPSMYSEKFILTDKPHSKIREKGFPLDSMSIDMKTNRYYYDLAEDELAQFDVEDGFLQFFQKVLSLDQSGSRR